MNILIVTPIHPMQILELNDLNKFTQYNHVFSAQVMALLYSEAKNIPYYAANQLIGQHILKHPSWLKPQNRKCKHNIYYGNLPRNTKIKFDHILGCGYDYITTDEAWDTYLTQGTEALSKYCTPVEWYTKDDVQFWLPNMHHIHTFLTANGIKENDNGDDTIQS